MVNKISSLDLSTINPTDKFFIDTNVLSFLHYGYSNNARKTAAYSAFISFLLKNKIALHVSVFNLQELLHLVEKLEYGKYKTTTQAPTLTKKQFRSNSAERAKISNILLSIISQIKNAYTIHEDSISAQDIDDFLNKYNSHKYDPIDYIMVNHSRSECINFITDDSDFKSDSRINVYSYN